VIGRLVLLLVSISSVWTVRAAQLPTFRARVSLVRIDVLVTDRNKPVLNLMPQDFDVLDNGVPQKIESIFGETEPLDVLFTFDRSGSVQGETIRHLKDASHAVLDQLTPADRAGLITFNYSFRLRAPLTTDQTAIRSAIGSIEPGGATALLDTMYAALSLAESRSRRTLILLFTDGWDNLSWLSKGKVLNVARESEAVVYAVAYKSRDSSGPDEALLKDLSEATGGRVVWVDTSDRLTRVFVAMLHEMRSRYLLTYSPTGVDTPGWHAISVRLKHKTGRVVARHGYFLRPTEPR